MLGFTDQINIYLDCEQGQRQGKGRVVSEFLTALLLLKDAPGQHAGLIKKS